MYGTQKNRQAFNLVMVCVIASGCFWAVYAFTKVFSPPPPRVPVPAAQAGAGRIMRVSAYCPCKICCGKWADGYTASGKPAVGLIVAAPPNIAFGTVLKIPGYGVAAVQDRGGAITGNSLDILFATHPEALNWGVQEIVVREVK